MGIKYTSLTKKAMMICFETHKNQKDKRKEIIITNIIENDKINITVKNDTKLLRTMIGRLFA